MGILRGYFCRRCPLAFEIGGYAFWELNGRLEQAVCTACGTMHRLTEQNGTCQVTALAGPVRDLPLVTRQSVAGREYQDYDWPFTEADWQPLGEHPGGIEALVTLACARCGSVGAMQTLTVPPHPDGFWVSFREACPLCDGPMPALYDTTVN
jgi:hypothetical protein